MLLDIFDMLHYLIGLIIVAFLIWCIIKTHNYFSKNNIKIIERNMIPNKA
jgi:tellurite resistance protein TehA-like permease